MTFQVYGLCETAGAHVTLKGSRSRVDQKMTFQPAGEGKFFITLFTAINLLARGGDNLVS